LFDRDEVEVACIGGGLGSDFLGALKYLMEGGLTPRVRCWSFDREQAWTESWSDVDRQPNWLRYRKPTESSCRYALNGIIWSKALWMLAVWTRVDWKTLQERGLLHFKKAIAMNVVASLHETSANTTPVRTVVSTVMPYLTGNSHKSGTANMILVQIFSSNRNKFSNLIFKKDRQISLLPNPSL